MNKSLLHILCLCHGLGQKNQYFANCQHNPINTIALSYQQFMINGSNLPKHLCVGMCGGKVKQRHIWGTHSRDITNPINIQEQIIIVVVGRCIVIIFLSPDYCYTKDTCYEQ